MVWPFSDKPIKPLLMRAVYENSSHRRKWIVGDGLYRALHARGGKVRRFNTENAAQKAADKWNKEKP